MHATKKNTENRDLTKIEAGEAEIWCTSAVLHGETENIDETMLTRKKKTKKKTKGRAPPRALPSAPPSLLLKKRVGVWDLCNRFIVFCVFLAHVISSRPLVVRTSYSIEMRVQRNKQRLPSRRYG